MPQQSFDNKTLANLILSKKLATLEQIQTLWQYCTPQKDIGTLCVEQGIISPVIYQKMVAFLIAQAQQDSDQRVGSLQRPVSADTGPMQQQNTMQSGNSTQPASAVPPNTRIEGQIHQQKVASAQHTIKTDATVSPATREAAVSMQKFTGTNSELPPIGNVSSVANILKYARMISASDVHISVNSPLIVRRFGSLVKVNDTVLQPNMTKKLTGTILSTDQQEHLEKTGDVEFVYELVGAGRFRVTAMKHRAGWDLTARCIPDSVRTLEETGMPESCEVLTRWAQGLVLVTGPACCGKSTTLTTLIEMINQTRNDHIITLESPIEYIFTSAHSQITQREIGRDTTNQETALRAALREDPDIIVIGELRDLAAIRLAVSAAETGHLVFATMNTVSASRTIYRLIDSFPPEEQGIMRNMISESLRGVISQQLIPRADGYGMVAAFEVLLVNTAVSNMIRKDEAHQLGTAMITGKAAGMQLLDDSLNTLAAQGLITHVEVAARSMARVTIK